MCFCNLNGIITSNLIPTFDFMGKKLFQDLNPSRIVKPFENKERIILRDYLALQRTSLANERTLFSYIRISLYLVIGAIGLLNLDDLKHLVWLAYFSYVIAAVMLVYGVVRYFILRRRLQSFYDAVELPEFDEVKNEVEKNV